MSLPSFTVVVPTHKRPALLREALASVAAQTLTASQVIVVDDAADPATQAVAAEFPSVEYVANDGKGGGSGARNAGIARATGEWVAFLDDDDLWAPHKLSAVSAVIQRSGPELALVYSAAERFDASSGAVISRTHPKARGRVLEDVLYQNVIGGMSVVVARREALEQVGGLDERFPALQDMELFVRLAEVGTFDFVGDVLVRVRVATGAGRITLDPGKKLAGAKLFAEKYDRLLANRPRHRHRAASRTFLLALAARDYREAARSLPWTVAGLFVDPRNLRYVARGVARHARSTLTAVRARPAAR